MDKQYKNVISKDELRVPEDNKTFKEGICYVCVANEDTVLPTVSVENRDTYLDTEEPIVKGTVFVFSVDDVNTDMDAVRISWSELKGVSYNKRTPDELNQLRTGFTQEYLKDVCKTLGYMDISNVGKGFSRL